MDASRLHIQRVGDHPNAFSIIMDEEDHTMGNLLCAHISKHMVPQMVDFVAYAPVGDEKCIRVTIAMVAGANLRDVLQTALNQLSAEIMEGQENFRLNLVEFKKGQEGN
jgi:DNA-directed RNA polymerase subunit L